MSDDQELEVMFYWDENEGLILRVFTSEETLEYDFDGEEVLKLYSFLKKKVKSGELETSLITKIFNIFSK